MANLSEIRLFLYVYQHKNCKHSERNEMKVSNTGNRDKLALLKQHQEHGSFTNLNEIIEGKLGVIIPQL